MRITKAQRKAVREKCNGRCAYCGDPLGDRWHADHIDAVMRSPEMWDSDEQRLVPLPTGMLRPQNDTIDNMLPACVPCNLYKATYNLDEFRKVIAGTVGVLDRNSSAYRHARRFGLVTEVQKPVVFYFETLDVEAAE